MLFALAKKIGMADRAIRRETIADRSSFTNTELRGKTLGLVGLGRSIFGIIDRSLVSHGLETLHDRLGDGGSRPVAQFVTTTTAGQLIRAQMAPVISGAGDITGYVLKDELLSSLVQQEGDRTLGDFRRDIIVAKEDQPLPDLFSRLVEKREHIALVVDEFGGMAGIVTMEDVMETLLGLEITDESDSTDDMQALARKKWEQRARRIGLIEKDAGAPD